MTPISLQCNYLTVRICVTEERGVVHGAPTDFVYNHVYIRSISATVAIPGAILFACFYPLLGWD